MEEKERPGGRRTATEAFETPPSYREKNKERERERVVRLVVAAEGPWRPPDGSPPFTRLR